MALAACQRAEPQPAPVATTAPPPASTAPPASISPGAEVPLPPPSPTPSPLTLAPSSAPPPAIPITSVLVLGDSLADERVGGGGFVKHLRRHCSGVSFDNRAKGGFMVNQIWRQLQSEILPEGARYSHAIVMGGVNDLYSDQTANRTLARIQADLTRIYDALRERGVRVIAITVTPWGGFKHWYSEERGRNTLTLNGWILEQAERGLIAEAVDAYPLLSCGDPALLCPELSAPYKDGLHFGKLGHQKLGEELTRSAFRSCSGD